MQTALFDVILVKIFEMRKVLFVLIGVSLLVGCGSKEDGNGHEGDQEQQHETSMVAANETLNLGIEGMVCSVGCAKAIEEKVGGMDGVASCVVSFKEGTAEIKFDNKLISSENIKETITTMNDGQYKVNDIVQDTDSKSADESGSDDASEDMAQVHSGLTPSFSIPQLVTYLTNIF